MRSRKIKTAANCTGMVDEPIGALVGVKVEMKQGFAFVFFADQASANDAIAGMKGKELHGADITVELA